MLSEAISLAANLIRAEGSKENKIFNVMESRGLNIAI